ncbi:MAG: coproporphyrinogen dehydrogenase HemZ, partial [Ruminococcus sp.]|nr:coproporphyrinogen dehydrogenase HemZ [Ruminococcus sp.]
MIKADDYRMPVVLTGNSFKYEIEAVCKLFFHTARFKFSNDINDAQGNNYILASVIYDNGLFVVSQIRLNGDEPEHEIKSLPFSAEKNDIEHELCRLIYHILYKKTGINPPWGLMTGIRPVKKVTELIQQGFSESEIRQRLTERYELSPKKFSLAYETAVNQLPVINNIDRSAASLYVSIPFCPTRCSYCSFVSHSMDSAVKLIPQYVEALCRELEIIGGIVRDTGTRIDTIYFGGGTPTSLSARDIRRIMESVAENFDISAVREYCFEAGRPDTITAEKLHVIKEMGADRISVNPQTLNDDVLSVIGRKHSGSDALRAFEAARKAGFRNINTDLIAGLPTES